MEGDSEPVFKLYMKGASEHTQIKGDLNDHIFWEGHSTFFQVEVCGPDFRSVGLAN